MVEKFHIEIKSLLANQQSHLHVSSKKPFQPGRTRYRKSKEVEIVHLSQTQALQIYSTWAIIHLSEDLDLDHQLEEAEVLADILAPDRHLDADVILAPDPHPDVDETLAQDLHPDTDETLAPDLHPDADEIHAHLHLTKIALHHIEIAITKIVEIEEITNMEVEPKNMNGEDRKIML